ncbi:MAG: hypothetical protein MK319_04090 [Pseudomonadales bacterium]|nr:hypothetical protein [Pseudomonadales bacterium]
MTALIKVWADFVIAHRLAIIVMTVLLLPLILFTGRAIPFDNSTARYFIDGDPALIEFDQLVELFGDNEYLIVGLEAAPGVEDIFNRDTLQAIRKISDYLDFDPAITQLQSLTSYQYIHADGDDLSIDYLIEDIDDLLSQASAVEELKAILRQEDLALDTLITRDFRHTRITARVEYREDTSAHKIEVVKRKIASKHALERVINTFFDDSPLLAVNSLLEMKKGGISESELAILEAMIEKRKKK